MPRKPQTNEDLLLLDENILKNIDSDRSDWVAREYEYNDRLTKSAQTYINSGNYALAIEELNKGLESGMVAITLNVILELIKLYSTVPELYGKDKISNLRELAELKCNELKDISSPYTLLYYCVKAAKPPCSIKNAREIVLDFPGKISVEISEQSKLEHVRSTAQLYLKIGFYSLAIEWYFKMPKIPNWDLCELASIYKTIDEIPEAVACLIKAESERLIIEENLVTLPQDLSEIREFLDRVVLLPAQIKLDEGGLCKIGDIYKKQGNLIAAKMCYEKALEDPARKGQAYYKLGVLQEQSGDEISALKNYKEAAKEGDLSAKQKLVLHYIQDERNERNVEIASQYFDVLLNPHLEPFFKQELDALVDAGNMAAKLVLSNLDIFGFTKIELYKEMSDTKIPYYCQKAIDGLMKMDFFDAKIVAAQILTNLNRDVEAEALYRELLADENPYKATHAMFMLGVFFESRGNFKQAKECYAKVQYPKDIKDLKDIKKFGLSAIIIPDNLALAMYKLADMYAEQEAIEAQNRKKSVWLPIACEWYKKSALVPFQEQQGLNNSLLFFQDSIRKTFQRAKSYAGFNEAVAKLKVLSKTDPYAMVALGDIYTAQGYSDDARALYYKAASEPYEISLAMKKMAEISEKLGNTEVAIHWLYKSYQTDGNSDSLLKLQSYMQDKLGDEYNNLIESTLGLTCALNFDLMIAPVFIVLESAGNAVVKTYEKDSIMHEIVRQRNVAGADLYDTDEQEPSIFDIDGLYFVDPATSIQTNIEISKPSDVKRISFKTNKVLADFGQYILFSKSSPIDIAAYPGFINPQSGERYILPYLTEDGDTVEYDNPRALYPNTQILNLMLKYPITATQLYAKALEYKADDKDLEYLTLLLKAYSRAEKSSDILNKISDEITQYIKSTSNSGSVRQQIAEAIKASLGVEYGKFAELLQCGITHALILDPITVITKNSVQTYEANDFLNWVALGKITDPLSNEQISLFIPNNAVANLIPYLLSGGNLYNYPGFFDAEGNRLQDAYLNKLGQTVTKTDPGAVCENFTLNRLIKEFSIPDKLVKSFKLS